jgi:thiamine-phosphate pyrophosphorylase
MAVDPRSLRVYVVTSANGVPGRTHRDVAFAAIDGGATAIQLRAPELDDNAIHDAARAIGERCDDAGVLFVVNDRTDVAAAVGAGAHVGRDDEPGRARLVLGDDAVLGVSVETPGDALAAVDVGADYVGVTVWATPTKPEAHPRGLHGLRAIVDAVDLPVVAIGGIDARNAREVLGAGASGVAVVSAVGAAPDPVVATRRLAAALDGETDA